MAVAAMALFLARPSLAEELYRLHDDFDGDDKLDAVPLEVSSGPASEDWRSTATVKIGSATYSTEYFSAEGDRPTIKILQIHNGHPLLLLDIPETIGCSFRILSLVDQKLVPLLETGAAHDCKPPQSLGPGLIATYSWQGFWEKEEQYRLNTAGTDLALDVPETYSVWVAGAAAKPFTLQGAECPAKLMEPKTFLRVELYDPQRDRYRLKTSDGGCGWLPAKDLQKTIAELPWAG